MTNITQFINIHYVWDGLIVWSVIALAAMAFVRGADGRRDEPAQPAGQLEAQ